MHQALAVGQAGADRPADPERAPFEGEEPDDLRPLLEHGHSGAGADPAHTHRELGGEEGVGQRGVAVQLPPAGELGRAALTGVDHRDRRHS